jgi:hypothetical protein
MFHPTHRVPNSGAPAWEVPDPARAATHRLDPDLPVRLLEQTTGWAHVRCSNGWETWTDAQQLVRIELRPTRIVPAGGLDAWAEPDAARPPDARVDAGLRVEVLEESQGWAFVRFDNGWEAWVDGRRLEPLAARARRVPPSGFAAVLLTVVLPAALVVLGSLLPWYSVGSESANAWDVEVVSLFTHESSDVDLKTGPVLVGVAVIALGLAAIRLERRVAIVVYGVLGLVALALGVLGIVLYLDTPEPRPELGIGILLTIAGGITLAVAGALSAGNAVRADRALA